MECTYASYPEQDRPRRNRDARHRRGERSSFVPSEPLMAPGHSPSFLLAPGPTNWDFVALAGGDGPQGSSKAFTQSGESVIASAVSGGVGTAFPQVYSKGSALPVGDEERGLGLCISVA